MKIGAWFLGVLAVLSTTAALVFLWVYGDSSSANVLASCAAGFGTVAAVAVALASTAESERSTRDAIQAMRDQVVALNEANEIAARHAERSEQHQRFQRQGPVGRRIDLAMRMAESADRESKDK